MKENEVEHITKIISKEINLINAHIDPINDTQ